MSTAPTVSVIITFFRAPLPFFREAIESVLAQTYDRWELLLVDDGAEQESVALAHEYVVRRPSQIRYLHHTDHSNRGMSASRQLGISGAHGKYVAFLDSDDVWLPQKLQDQVAILERNPEAGMLYGNTLYWSTWSDSATGRQSDFLPALGVQANRVVSPPTLVPLFVQGRAAVPCTCSILVRKVALDRTGGFEGRFRQLYEDQVFYAKMCLELPVYVSDKCWDKYRQHPSSATAAAGAASERAARLEFLTWLETYLEERGRTGGAVWSAVQSELWMTRLDPRLRRVMKALRRLTATLSRIRRDSV